MFRPEAAEVVKLASRQNAETRPRVCSHGLAENLFERYLGNNVMKPDFLDSAGICFNSAARAFERAGPWPFAASRLTMFLPGTLGRIHDCN